MILQKRLIESQLWSLAQPLTKVDGYKNGVVEQIVVSGHQDGNGYDEPGSMKAYAIAAGVTDSDIVIDSRGDRTYDTCFRARNEF